MRGRKIGPRAPGIEPASRMFVTKNANHCAVVGRMLVSVEWRYLLSSVAIFVNISALLDSIYYTLPIGINKSKNSSVTDMIDLHKTHSSQKLRFPVCIMSKVQAQCKLDFGLTSFARLSITIHLSFRVRHPKYPPPKRCTYECHL